jgi:hypothetical protein
MALDLPTMPLASKHILIVEDSDQIRKLLAQA